MENNNLPAEQHVWLEAWKTSAIASNMQSPTLAVIDADNCLKEFKKRFLLKNTILEVLRVLKSEGFNIADSGIFIDIKDDKINLEIKVFESIKIELDTDSCLHFYNNKVFIFNTIRDKLFENGAKIEHERRRY